MKIAYSWLKDFIALPEDPATVAHRLTQCGLEVEGLDESEQIRGGLKGIVIAEVLERSQHPNADRLSVCQVDIGQGAPVQIVCGAANVAAGQKVVVATVGATLYPSSGESFQIKKSKIRGEESNGMICAEDEIGLGASHDGIMVLQTQLPNGAPAAAHFALENETVFEIGLTPNRADAASHLGVARDLRALFNRRLTLPDLSSFTPGTDRPVTISVQNPEACPRYAGLVMTGVQVGPSPAWLQNRLRSIGLAPINNVVDVTNYVLHSLGQPLHAFDLDKIAGGQLIIRNAAGGEKLVTLDGIERTFKGHELLIADAEKALAIGGVFGGADSGINASTTRIFIESAYFHPDSVRKTAMTHGLKTDASFRFERGTDPDMPVLALQFAAGLLQQLAGAQVASVVYDEYAQPIGKRRVPVTYAGIARIMGFPLEPQQVKEILNNLDIEIEADQSYGHAGFEEGFTALVPPYRVDVLGEHDIAEELLRIVGLDNVPLRPIMSSNFIAPQPRPDKVSLQHNTARLLCGMGFSEMINNSLCHARYSRQVPGFDPEANVVLMNRLSEDLEVMRQSLLFSALDTVAYNINRRQLNLKLFEFGKEYRKTENGNDERWVLSLVVTGNADEDSWQTKEGGKPRRADFFLLKQALTSVLARLGLQNEKRGYTFKEAAEPWLDYGLSLHWRNRQVGVIGAVGSQALKLAGIKQPLFYAQLDWQALAAAYNPSLEVVEVPRFPEVQRDLSMIIDRGLQFEQLEQTARRAGGKLLQQVNVFDVYLGENIGADKKSYALSFTLQDSEKTLTDEVIDKTMERIMQQLESGHGATIRKA